MDRPIRILHVLAGMNQGGAETFVMNVYRNIDRNRIQFDFVLFTKKECYFNNEIRQLGGKIFWIPRYNGRNHFTFKKAWDSFFYEHEEYKIIHAHVRSTASLYLRIAKKHGLTTIVHSHSTGSRGNTLERTVKYLLQLRIKKDADYLLAASDKAGHWLYGSKAMRNTNYSLINNAIEAEKFSFDETTRKKYRKLLDIENKFVIGHIGSFTFPKNHNFLIDIFNQVYKRQRNAVLLLVGDGVLRAKIESKVKMSGLDNNVIFLGIRDDIHKILQAVDVFVFPSIFEGLGIALIEAQASGLQCVVSDSIPKEAYVTELVQSVSLKASSLDWAEKILNTGNYKRINTIEKINASGYNVKDTSIWMEEFYSKLRTN